MTQNVYTIILAGGSGQRMGTDIPKQFLPLGPHPLIVETLSRFSALGEVTGILVVLPEEHRSLGEKIFTEHPDKKLLSLVTGGATRRESALHALTSREFLPDDIILIHDAARPFVSKNLIRACIRDARETGAAGPYLPAADTITEIHNHRVVSIPDRSSLFYTQTPQAFRYRVLMAGHELARKEPDRSWTDDVSMVLATGKEVAAVAGDPKNIKITTPFDYNLALWLIERETDG